MNLAFKHPVFFFFLSLLALFLSAQTFTAIQNLFVLNLPNDLQQLIIQPWRLVTGHWVHFSWPHLAVNTLTFIAVLWVFQESFHLKESYLFILFSSLFISFGLWVFSQITIYFGFSGVLYGFICWQLLKSFSLSPKIYGSALCLIIIKVILDRITGGSPMVEKFIGLPISKDAHWLGVVSGLLFWIFCVINRKKK